MIIILTFFLKKRKVNIFGMLHLLHWFKIPCGKTTEAEESTLSRRYNTTLKLFRWITLFSKSALRNSSDPVHPHHHRRSCNQS